MQPLRRSLMILFLSLSGQSCAQLPVPPLVHPEVSADKLCFQLKEWTSIEVYIRELRSYARSCHE